MVKKKKILKRHGFKYGILPSVVNVETTSPSPLKTVAIRGYRMSPIFRRLILAPENPFIDTLNIYRYFIGRTSANMFFKATARIFAAIG
jgi:hypothetical protein